MLTRMLSISSGRWMLFMLGWAALSLLFAPEVYVSFLVRGQAIGWCETLSLTLQNAAIALLFVPGIVVLTRRYPLERKNWRTALLVHIVGCLVFSLGYSALYWAACYLWYDPGRTLF